MNLSPMTLTILGTLAALIVVLVAVNKYLPQFFWRITTSFVPLVVAALVVVNAYYKHSFKLGVDLVGGTILVYEVDESKFPEGKIPANYKPEDLAAALKRRIDPADLYNVTIRPVSSTRVEIILPTGGSSEAREEQQAWETLIERVSEKWAPAAGTSYVAPVGQIQQLGDEVLKAHPELSRKDIDEYITSHAGAQGQKKFLTAEKVQEVKEDITQVGSLEFRILANERDDAEAIGVARKYFEEAKTNNAIKKALEDAAIGHKPPPGPKPPEGEAFKIKLGNATENHTYTWVELGRQERKQLGLDNASEKTATPNSMWAQVAKAREAGETTFLPGVQGLLYSREVQNPATLTAKEQGKKYEYFVLTRDPEPGKAVTGKYLTRVEDTVDQRGRPAVGFHFNQQGGLFFGELTTRNAKEDNFYRYLAIALDGKIESAPRLNSPIHTDGIIEGEFSKPEVDRTVRILRSGQLPATLKQTPVSENTMGATLGADTIFKGTVSVGIAFLSILIFMAVYYRFAGLVACVALLANLLLTVAFMVAVQATFTLPGLAGLVLMLGMAVDANVLIYERLREERDRGASLPLAIRNGYDRAFPTIIDTHLSSIFTAIVLYAVGNDQLKGFGISLTVGLIISLFTSLFMTRLMFDLWQSKNWLHKLSMMRLFSKPNIDFMRIRYYWFTATILLTIFGASVFIARLPNDLNIDFVGGTAYGGQLARPMKIKELRDLLSEDNQKVRLEVVDVKQLDSGGFEFAIYYKRETEPRRIVLPNPTNVDDIRKRAQTLPDLSVEQIYRRYGSGDATDLFTIRTSEKAPELVQASIGRLLGDKLKRILMEATVTEPGHTATLKFFDAGDTEGGERTATYASPSQVRMLLEREFRAQGITTPFHLITQGEWGNKEDRYREMKLAMSDTLKPPERFQKVLTDTQREFSNRPQPDRLENFDSQLAKNTQLSALYAILLSWGAILLYLWFRFGSWTFGAAAVLCLIHDLFFTLGIIAFAHYIHLWAPGLASALMLEDFKIDLPAVAALLTLVGYSVNDTIVVFDRIREVRGKNPELTAQTINDSVNQTLSRTLLTSFATWLVVIVLYIFGGEGVHLFSFCMVVGVIVGTYSSIYIASPLLLIFGEGVPAKSGEQRKQQPAEATA
jgi:SecD/SecF fusion protein